MRRRLFGFVLVGVSVLALTAARGMATSVIAPTFDELVAEARTVFAGEVVDVRSEWQESRSGVSIVTLVTFRVDEVMKGADAAQTVLEFLGGTVDGQTLEVAGMPQFKVGDRDVLFVGANTRAISPLVGFMHGRFRVSRDPYTGRDVVGTHTGRAVADVTEIGRPPASPLRAGPAMTLSDFKNRVRGKAREQGERRQ